MTDLTRRSLMIGPFAIAGAAFLAACIYNPIVLPVAIVLVGASLWFTWALISFLDEKW